MARTSVIIIGVMLIMAGVAASVYGLDPASLSFGTAVLQSGVMVVCFGLLLIALALLAGSLEKNMAAALAAPEIAQRSAPETSADTLAVAPVPATAPSTASRPAPSPMPEPEPVKPSWEVAAATPPASDVKKPAWSKPALASATAGLAAAAIASAARGDASVAHTDAGSAQADAHIAKSDEASDQSDLFVAGTNRIPTPETPLPTLPEPAIAPPHIDVQLPHQAFDLDKSLETMLSDLRVTRTRSSDNVLMHPSWIDPESTGSEDDGYLEEVGEPEEIDDPADLQSEVASFQQVSRHLLGEETIFDETPKSVVLPPPVESDAITREDFHNIATQASEAGRDITAPLLREGIIANIPFKLYGDGSVLAELERGERVFSSLKEFREFVGG